MPAPAARPFLPIALQTTTPLYKLSQSIISTNHWSSLRSIVLLGDGIPIRNELISGSSKVSQNFSSSNSLSIISDFLIDFNILNDRFVLEYLPTAQYRYIDLIGHTPLTSISINIQFTDFSGNIYPVYLTPGAGMSIKFIFEKRKHENK
jgi:hypothetical protein